MNDKHAEALCLVMVRSVKVLAILNNAVNIHFEVFVV